MKRQCIRQVPKHIQGATYQISPCLLFIVFCLQLINLQEPVESTDTVSTLQRSLQRKVTHVRPPSSVQSRKSISSSLVSSENGAPLVSRAYASSPSEVRDAPSGGVNRAMRLSSVGGFGGDGTQYFAKMCFKHNSNCRVIEKSRSFRVLMSVNRKCFSPEEKWRRHRPAIAHLLENFYVLALILALGFRHEGTACPSQKLDEVSMPFWCPTGTEIRLALVSNRPS